MQEFLLHPVDEIVFIIAIYKQLFIDVLDILPYRYLNKGYAYIIKFWY